MKLYTSEHSKMAERYAMDTLGVPSVLLMEHAARGVYEEILRVFPKPNNYKFLVLYGPGNNGGDALCLARMLLLRFCSVNMVEVLGPPQTLDGGLQMKFLLETIKNADETIKNADGGEYHKVNFLNSSNVLTYIDKDTIVIDGVFGTGFNHKKNTEMSREVFELFTTLKKSKYIFSIDVPSGLDSDTGELAEWAVSSDCTVSFIYPKVGLFVSPGSINSGKIKMKSLFFPKEEGAFDTKHELITPKLIRKLLEPVKRKRDSHKGTYGHVAILAPQEGMEGAVALSALAALKSGAGLITVLALDEEEGALRRRMTNLIPEVIIRKIKTDELDSAFEKFDSVLAGPGLGVKNADKFKKIIKAIDKPLVLDADALNIISEDLEIFNIIKTKSNIILTPHPGEMLRLFPETLDVQSKRLQVLESFLKKHLPNVPCILLKGYRSMLGVLQTEIDKKDLQDEGKLKQKYEYKIFINPTGGPSLSKGGSGDVLSGMIASFCSQGLQIWQAGILATYLHGLSGDIIAKKRGTEFDTLPTEIINGIGEAVQCLTF